MDFAYIFSQNLTYCSIVILQKGFIPDSGAIYAIYTRAHTKLQCALQLIPSSIFLVQKQTFRKIFFFLSLFFSFFFIHSNTADAISHNDFCSFLSPRNKKKKTKKKNKKKRKKKEKKK